MYCGIHCYSKNEGKHTGGVYVIALLFRQDTTACMFSACTMCVLVCVCLCLCVWVCMRACVCLSLSLCLSVCMSACVCVFVRACVRACVCVCICVCVCVCVCYHDFQTRSSRGRKLFHSIFNSEIQLSVYSFSCFRSVCPSVTLLKATYAENSLIVLSCPH